ncbi:MAG: AsmA family protein [Candidatus Omnitrophica bacterium]|nr:AsmA family protein [Candidatus Omnitrophota bacterium]
MIKKISITIAILLVIISAGIFYVNKVLMPVQIKGLVIKAAQDALHRKVTLDSIQINPVKGLVVNDFTVYSKDKPDEVLFHVKEASAQVLLLALLQKKIVISSVRINEPSARLIRFDDNLWNFSDLLKPSPDASKDEKQAFSFFVSGISIANGRVKLEDASGAEPFSEMIGPMNLKGSLSLTGGVNISGDIALPSTQGNFKFDVRGVLKNQSFKGDLKIHNLVVTKYLRFAPALPLKLRALSMSDAQLSFFLEKSDVAVSGNAIVPEIDISPLEGNAAFQGGVGLNKISLSLKNGILNFQGGVSTDKTVLILPDGKYFTGSLLASVSNLAVNKNDIDFNGSLSAIITKLSIDQSKTLTGALKTRNTKFAITDGKISASSDLELKNAIIKLGEDQTLEASFSIPALTITPGEKGLDIKTEIKADNTRLTLPKDQKISFDLLLTNLNALVTGSNIFLKTDLALRETKVDLPAFLANADILANDTRVSFENGKLTAASRLAFQKTAVTVNKTTKFSGDPDLSVHLEFDPQAPNPLSYTGTMELNKGSLSGLPNISQLSDITAKIIFETNRAHTKNLSFSVFDTPVAVSGEIKNFAAPKINADIAINKVDLAVAEKIIPDIIKDQGLIIKGNASLKAHMEGALADIQNAKINAAAQIKNVYCESSKLKQKVEDASGTVSYTSPTLSWKDLTLKYRDKTYLLNGYLQDFASPFTAGSIKGENILADFQVKKDKNEIHIESLTATYFDSTLDAKGLVRLPEEGQGEPYIDVNTETKLSLKDLPKIELLSQEQIRQIESLKLAGILKIKADIKGKPSQWPQWRSTLRVETPALYMMGYEVENLLVTSTQKDGVVEPLTINGTFYGGNMDISAKVAVSDKKFPFTTDFKLDHTSLELLKKATPMKDQQFSGNLDLTGNLQGDVLNIRKMTGTSKMMISGGYLWSRNFMPQILSVLSASFQGGDITITDATGTFNFADARVTTDDLTLKGTGISILVNGWADWDQNMDFNITPQLDPVSGAGGAANVLTLVNPTSGLVNVHVGGTFSKPVIEHNISAPQVIKKTLQNTVGGLLKLFE